MSESDIKPEGSKGEYQFFIGEEDKMKARLDLIDLDSGNGNQELNRFFLGSNNNDH